MAILSCRQRTKREIRVDELRAVKFVTDRHEQTEQQKNWTRSYVGKTKDFLVARRCAAASWPVAADAGIHAGSRLKTRLLLVLLCY